MAERGDGDSMIGGVAAEWKNLSTMPDKLLRHAASMPSTYDTSAQRPFCGRMWKLQQLVGFCLGLLLLVIPILVNPITYYPQSNPMLGITLLCGCFWVFEVLPIYATALIPVVLMPLFTITSSANAAMAYWRPIQILVVGVYLVDIALMQGSLPKRMALRLLASMKTFSPGSLLFCFMFGAWILSIFVNNIAVALLLTPFAASLVTAAEDEAIELVNGPRDGDESGSDSAMSQEDLASEVKNLGRALMLGIAFAANAGGLATLTGCIPNEVLMGGPAIQEVLNYRRWMAMAAPVSLIAFAVSYGVIYARYLCNSALTGMSSDILKRERDEFLATVGTISRDEVIVASVAVLQVGLLWCRPWIAGEFVGPQGQRYVGDESLALLCALLLFVVPSTVEPGHPVLQWQDVQDHFNFGLLMLIGGGFAISYGFEQSGLSIALAHDLTPRLKMHTGLVETFMVLLLGTACTQVFSSVAASTVLLPALRSAAINTMENPLSYLIPATVGCSFGFVLPSSAAPNVIVMAKSADLRVRDFVITGLITMFLVLILGGPVLGMLESPIFDANSPFPQWACDDVSCLWVPVPGVVNGGVQVDSQGCGLLDFTNGTMCKLWNGTQLNTMDFINASWMV
mmetsp:Transcript_65760/g.189603  ORF Transcript_65760/g.189603 Transcript_65760/m.189603 type:complete len:626 (-) Transcript_65760:194-2071(-)